jgi:hypothetical protein
MVWATLAMDSALLLASKLLLLLLILIIIIISLVVEQFDKLERNSHVHNLHTRHIYDPHMLSFNVTKCQKGENYTFIKSFGNSPSKVQITI